jgi:hypothetical protein
MDVCPKCGAGLEKAGIYYDIYECGSVYDRDTGVLSDAGRGEGCYEVEIANLKAQLADREDRLEAYRKIKWLIQAESKIGYCTEDCHELIALGEIT